MTDKHTPGPWTITGPNDTGSAPFAVFSSRNACLAPRVSKANARLIAAAPELLSALDSIRFIAEGQPTTDATLVTIQRMARAAIKAAKGDA